MTVRLRSDAAARNLPGLSCAECGSTNTWVDEDERTCGLVDVLVCVSCGHDEPLSLWPTG